MPHSKTPGQSGAMSAKAEKQMREKEGAGTAPEAPAKKDIDPPGAKPAASDSGISSVGIQTGTNQPGEKGELGPQMPSGPAPGQESEQQPPHE